MYTYNSRKALLSLTLTSIALALTACGGGGGGSSGGNNPPPSSTTYSLGGSVSGLAGSGLVLRDGAGHEAAVSANGAFTLASGMSTGTSYVVAVKTQPTSPNQTCTVTNGSGSISSANVTNVSVVCTTNGYTVGGTISGLTGTGLVLQNNGADDLAVTANGSFTFGKTVASGSAYAVSVKMQPSSPAQFCTVANGTGNVVNGNIATVTVSCSTTIVSANAKLVAAIGNGVIESLTQVADLVGSRLMYLKANLAPSLAQTCPAFGSQAAGAVNYVWADSDADHTLSAGDQVAVTFANCYVPSLAGTLDVSLTITLGAAPQPVDYQTGFTGTLNLISFPLTGDTLDGTLDILFKDSDEFRVVQGQVGSSGLSIAVTLAGTDDVVTVLSGTAKKTVDYVAAKYEVSAEADYKSLVSAGRFTLATTTPLSGVLNVYPDKGVEVFRSGSSVLSYNAQNAGANSSADAALDSDGTGTFASLGAHAWTESAKGFLWWEPRSGTVFPPANGYEISTLDAWKMRLMLASPLEDPANGVVGTSVASNVAIRLWFSGPVESTQTMTFVGVGGAVDVPASVTINGGFVTVTPSVALVPTASYQLTTPDGTVHSVWTGPLDPFHLDMTVGP
jgi:hypothetical protein